MITLPANPNIDDVFTFDGRSWRWDGARWISLLNIQGQEGPAGQGVPIGGTTGQILAKASATDFDAEWVAPPVAAGPSGASWELISSDTYSIQNGEMVASINANCSITMPATPTLGDFFAVICLSGKVSLFNGQANDSVFDSAGVKSPTSGGVSGTLQLDINAGAKSFYFYTSSNEWTEYSIKGTTSFYDAWYNLTSHGYYFAGYTGANTDRIDKLVFGTDTTLANVNNLHAALNGVMSVANDEVAIAAGGSAATNVAQEVDIATDLLSLRPSANLSSSRESGSAVGGKTHGYLAAGSSSTTVDKITFSTRTTAVSSSSALASGKRGLCGSGSSTKGYFTGGVTTLATTEVIPYSTDVRAAVPSANLTTGAQFFGGCSSATVAYFLSSTAQTAVNLLTDTASARSDLVLAGAHGEGVAACGNQTKGFFAGGGVSAITFTAQNNLLNYYTDSRSVVSSANLSQARGYFQGA